MAGTYVYTKASVNNTKLTLEIEAESFSQTLQHVSNNYEGSNNLTIQFAADLTGEEVTTLDALVVAHDGNAPTLYTIFCYSCGCSSSAFSLTALTACPCCSGTNIQTSYHNDNLNATTDPGVSNDGTEGYCEGSKWINVTLDKTFTCLDDSTGAAVWKQIDSADPLITSDSDIDVCMAQYSPTGTGEEHFYQWFPFHGHFASPPGSVTLSNISYTNCSSLAVTKITKSGFIAQVEIVNNLTYTECEFDWGA